MSMFQNAMTSFVTTANVPESERFDLWREAACNIFVNLDVFRNTEVPFFGEVATTRVNDVSFSLVRSCGQKVVRTPMHIRKTVEESVHVCLQLSGQCLVSQDGREARLESGDFACMDNSRPYSTLLNGNFEHLVLHIPREKWLRKIGNTEQVTARVVGGHSQLGTLVFNSLKQIVPAIDKVQPLTAHRLEEVSLALLKTAFGELNSQQPLHQDSGRVALIYRAKALIEENLHDPDFTPKKAASSLRISLRYLQNLFQEVNNTPSNWILERRLEKCYRDLLDPLLVDKRVSEIAFDCGFNDLSHFCHKFKAAFSISASEFRRKHLYGS